MKFPRCPSWPCLCLVLLAGCNGVEDVSPQSLSRAEQLWKQARIDDYDLEWTSNGDREGHYLVSVRGGQVHEIRSILPDGGSIAAHPGDSSYYGIEGLFRILEEEADQLLEARPFNMPQGTQALLKFSPDPKLGYPRHYRRDVVGSPRGLAIDVLRLDPKPSGSAVGAGKARD